MLLLIMLCCILMIRVWCRGSSPSTCGPLSIVRYQTKDLYATVQSSPEDTDVFYLRHLDCSLAKGCSDDAIGNIGLIDFLFVFDNTN